MADLDGDRDGETKRLILRHLDNLAVEIDREGMQVLDVQRTVRLPRMGDTAQSVARGHKDARALLAGSGANVMIWGELLSHNGDAEPSLYMTVSRERRGGMGSEIYSIDDEHRLPRRFWHDLGDVLSLLVVTEAGVFWGLEGHYVADPLRPFLHKVEALTRSQTFVKEWSRDSRGAVYM
ncbi:MAG: hypothetical protein AAGC55_10150, partial [Myxococcota bacterium]